MSKMSTVLRVIVVALALIGLAACSPDGGIDISFKLERHIDEEAGVVCWNFRGHAEIDCMPLSDTLLK